MSEPSANIAADPQRPVYHFLPPANWLNDPNGLIHWQGHYHMFYQHNPDGAYHANMHWGHARSADLVHWEHLPIALTPTPGGPDAGGCWSGCAVVADGVPSFIYTGFNQGDQRPCLATSSGDLVQLDKWPGNPIVPAPPAELDLIGFRDHSVWREDGLWHLLVGAGIRGVGGTALLYRSPDLHQWEYVHPIAIGDVNSTDPVWTGAMWECVDLFPLGDHHVLILSVCDEKKLYYSAALIGRYADQKFVPAQGQKLDAGDNYFYAPQSMRDPDGRRLVWGWVQEARSGDAQRASGWSGVMSMPRVLTLEADGILRMFPATELETLRGERHDLGPIDLPAGETVALEGVSGDTLELTATFEPGRATRVGLKIRCAPDGSEETTIYYDPTARRLGIDRSRSTLDQTVITTPNEGDLDLAPGEPLRLRVFLDRSVIEIFANERLALTSRVYPTRSDSLGLAAYSEGAASRLSAFTSWPLDSIWV